MTSLHFKVGEIAMVNCRAFPWYHGAVCEIEAVGPFPPGHVFADGSVAADGCDYSVLIFGSSICGWDCYLVKLLPPDEVLRMVRTQECEVRA